MTGKDLIDSMEYVDAVWIEEAEKLVQRKKIFWKPIAAIAACLVLAVGILFMATWQNRILVLSANDVAALFEEKNTAGDSFEIIPLLVSNPQELPLNPLPDTQTVLLFNRNDRSMGGYVSKMHDGLIPILKRMCHSLGITVPDENANYYDYMGYCFGGGRGVLGQYDFFFVERTWKLEYKSGQYDLYLDGEQVTIDQSQRDEEIIASLTSIKQKLFAIFGTEFSNAKVVRKYGYRSTHGAETVHIYYYNEAAHPLNKVQTIPVTDYIVITFDNYENWTGDILSADKLIDAKIGYRKYRLTPESHYKTIGKGKLISLEEAEERLSKGYVFGKSCQECKSEQSEFGCTHYDYVSFEYIGDHDREGINLVLPFYVFYSKAGNTPNGNEKYEITYVCAIEISGLEDYYLNKKE